MKITKTDMWVTPVWEIQTDFDQQFNNELLDELGQYCDPESDVGNSNIWNCDTPRVQELKKYTIKVVKSQTYDYIAPTVKDFEFWHARGWLNYHKTGEGIPIHGHGSPKIAMTYYVKAPDNCGDLLLIDPRNGCDWDSGNDGVNGTKFNRIKPVESKLVFFPGFVLHMVEPNQSDQVRVSVTSNMGTFDKSTAQAFKNTL
jgi:hypothetical protein